VINYQKNNLASKPTVIGLHKGKNVSGSIGITFNTLPNTQDIIFQLCEELNIEKYFDLYQQSSKKLRK